MKTPQPRIDKAILRKKADCFAVYNTPLSGLFQQEKEAVTSDRGSRVAPFAACLVTRACSRMKLMMLLTKNRVKWYQVDRKDTTSEEMVVL